jgi:hypothetical protein
VKDLTYVAISEDTNQHMQDWKSADVFVNDRLVVDQLNELKVWPCHDTLW